MKILLDENLSPAWIDLLRSSGFTAELWSSLGAFDAPDLEILAFALKNQYVILTQDLDFGLYLGVSLAGGPSVIQIRTSDTNPATIGPAVVKALLARKDELEQGAIITIEVSPTPRTRLTLLPIKRSPKQL